MNDQFRDSRHELFQESLCERHHMRRVPRVLAKGLTRFQGKLKCCVTFAVLFLSKFKYSFSAVFFSVQNIIIVLILVGRFGGEVLRIKLCVPT